MKSFYSFKKYLVFFLFLFVVACGRYGDPRAPEFFAPQGVNDLKATANLNGVLLEWKAPTLDRSGDTLKSINGYYVKRKTLSKNDGDLDVNSLEDSVLIATVKDDHLEVLKELRRKAIEDGRISRKVSIEEDLMQFSLEDTDVTPGVTYLYSIVPFNQRGTKGLVPLVVKVYYRGDSSVVSFLETKEFDSANLKKSKDKGGKFGLF